MRIILILFFTNVPLRTLGEKTIVTVMGRALKPGGKATADLVDRCRVAARAV